MSSEFEDRDRHVCTTRNQQIRSEVSKGLARWGASGMGGVTVEVDDDRILLTGTVPSYFMKQMAQEAARRACAGRRVYNELVVPRSA